MGRNKKLTKVIRERMARTGENYTAARTALLAEEREAAPPAASDDGAEIAFRVVAVDDPEVGTGAVAEDWRTLHVAYVVRRDGEVVDESREQPKRYALSPEHHSWMRALAGQRVGGLRRLDLQFFRRGWGRCTIEARLVAVTTYEAPRPSDLVRGEGRPARPGDRVRVRYIERIKVTDPLVEGAVLAKSGEHGVWATLGAGELDPDLERVALGMAEGGSRTADLPPRVGGPPRWVWLDLLELG